MVVAGLMTGNRGKELVMSDITRDYLGKFWEVTDEVLNAILFMLIGLEIVIVSFDMSYLAIGIITAIIILIARFVSLYIPAVLFRFKKAFGTKSLFIMTWGGLRGGISYLIAKWFSSISPELKSMADQGDKHDRNILFCASQRGFYRL